MRVLILLEDNAFSFKQGSAHSGNRRAAAGRAVRFEQGHLQPLHAGNGKYHAGSTDKGCAEIATMNVQYPGMAIQHGVAIPADKRGWRSGRGETAELFRAYGDIPVLIEQRAARFVLFAFSVVTGTQTKQTGADQTKRLGCHRRF